MRQNDLNINEIYKPFLFDKSRFHFLWGGSGSGKSRFMAQKYLLALNGNIFDRNFRAIALRKVKETAKESVFREIETVIDKQEVRGNFKITESPLHIQHKGTRNEVLFGGLDKVEKLKSISEPTDIWIEEAMETDKQDFVQLNLRLRGVENAQITCTFNPEYRIHYIPSMYPKLKESELGELVRGDQYLALRTIHSHNFYAGEEYAKQMEWLKKHDPDGYEIYALAKWGGRDKPDQLIPTGKVLTAINKVEPIKGEQKAGIDVARYGDDDTVFGKFTGNCFDYIERHDHKSIPETSRLAYTFISRYNIKPSLVGVDTVGYGAGVYDQLKEDSKPVKSVESGASAIDMEEDTDHVYSFDNLRAQMWWYLMLAFSKEEIAIDLPEDDQQRLLEELTSIKYIIDDKKVKIQSKKELKSDLGRSPDYADAMCYAYFVDKLESEPWVMWG